MNMIYKGARYIKDFYAQLNPATLTGAIDILVIEHPDGTLTASPFHVRFGKLGVIRAKEKIVNISINHNTVHLHMKLGDQGEAFFVVDTLEEESIPARYLTSPIPSRPCSPYIDNTEVSEQLTFELDLNKRRRRKRRKRKTSFAEVHSCTESEPDEDIQATLTDSQTTLTPKNSFESFQDAQNESCMEELTQQTSNNEDEDFELKRMISVFSDSELPNSVENLKISSRDASPYSDSETADHYNNQEAMMGQAVEWSWGQLPDPEDKKSNYDFMSASNVPPAKPEPIPAVSPDTSTLHKESLTTKPDNKTTVAGLYLDEVLGLDPNEADIYLNTNKDIGQTNDLGGRNDMDLALGRLPEISCGSDAGVDSGTDCLSDCGHVTFELSLCGGKLADDKLLVDYDKFQEKLINYEKFMENPMAVIKSTELVVRIGDIYLTWMDAQPLLIASSIYKQNLSPDVINGLLKHTKERSPSSSGGRLSWLFGGRGNRRESHRESTSSITSIEHTNATSNQTNKDDTLKEVVVTEPQLAKSFSVAPELASRDHESSSCDDELKEIENAKNSKHSFIRVNTLSDFSLPMSNSLKVMKKTTRLSSDQLKKLNLNPGGNEIMFSVTSQYQGTSKCCANIYLWKSSDKIIVSDVDGTITKSDVFGQILPVMGKDWTQGGVAQLYRNIEKNGYKFIYVSSRAIGQARMTKGYLNWINQQGVSLPPGPLFLSPTSLVQAFHREVIEKKPEKFKIECMNDVKELFPKDVNPFVAGFGNKSNDVTAYTAAGILPNRIFTINHKGELKQEELQTYKTSYCALGEIVDNFFPCLSNVKQLQEFNSFEYWKMDIPELADEMFNL